MLNILHAYLQAALEILPALLMAIVLWTGFWFLAKFIRQFAEKLAETFTDDPSLKRLFATLSRITVLTVGTLIAAAVVFPGLDVGDLVGVLGFTSVAVGFAFKDIFQNFLAGIIILTQRPFTIGDQIQAGTIGGEVKDINIRSSIIKTYDGQQIILPNTDLLTQAVTVRTAEMLRRSTFSTGIGYGEDIEQARDVMREALAHCDLVETEPPPQLHVVAHDSSSINFAIRYWSRSDMSTVRRAEDQVATALKYALDDAGIEIPFPQRDLHLHTSDMDRRQPLAPEIAPKAIH
ncbi:MAG: mechanosensitive ion channel family protein [Myxococcota bacterium]